MVAKDGSQYRLDYARPKSIGRVRSFFGNVGILLRGYCYIRTLGPAGLREVTENAVLNANYVLARVKGAYEVPHGERCMHEFVASARQLKREKRTSAMDIAKRLLDFGFHAPTVYFPLVVPEAIIPKVFMSIPALVQIAGLSMAIAGTIQFVNDGKASRIADLDGFKLGSTRLRMGVAPTRFMDGGTFTLGARF